MAGQAELQAIVTTLSAQEAALKQAHLDAFQRLNSKITFYQGVLDNPPTTILRFPFASGTKGSTVIVGVGFIAGSTPVSTLQFDGLCSNITFVSATAGQAATDAAKSAQGNAIIGGFRVLVFGLNQNPILTGELAKVNLTVSASAPSGILTVSIANVVASDPNGQTVRFSGIGGGIIVP